MDNVKRLDIARYEKEGIISPLILAEETLRMVQSGEVVRLAIVVEMADGSLDIGNHEISYLELIGFFAAGQQLAVQDMLEEGYDE